MCGMDEKPRQRSRKQRWKDMAPNIVFELWTNKKKLRIDCDLIHYGLMETQYITNHIELSWIFASILEAGDMLNCLQCICSKNDLFDC